METIQEFADSHRLRTRRDGRGDKIIPGRRSAKHHIFDNYDGRLGICLMFEEQPRKWTFAKRKGTSAGLIVRQDGHDEGTMLFDPADRKQAKMAIQLAGARVRRVLSISERQSLANRLEAARVPKMA